MEPYKLAIVLFALIDAIIIVYSLSSAMEDNTEEF
jgi:hypothetical protein